MANIRFHYADVKPITIKGKKAIQQFLNQVFSLEAKPVQSVNYIFCSDSYLLQMNRSFLQHDYYTDIITFDLSEGAGTIGEVYISTDRVKENAVSHQCSYSNEILRVMIHGALHLIGYKDKKKSEITIMRQKEDYYLRLFGSK
jgi:probable rRNA maturation factor